MARCTRTFVITGKNGIVEQQFSKFSDLRFHGIRMDSPEYTGHILSPIKIFTKQGFRIVVYGKINYAGGIELMYIYKL